MALPLRELVDAFCGVIALHHGAHLRHGLLCGLSLSDQNACAAVPGVHGGAGDDQIAHTRQTAEGLPGAAQLFAKARQFRHGAGHQQSLCIVLIAHAVTYAAGQSHYVFHGGGQLHAHDILTGIDPEIVIHESVLYQPGHFQIRTGGHAAGGHPNAYFLCVRGTGKGSYFTDVPGDFR